MFVLIKFFIGGGFFFCRVLEVKVFIFKFCDIVCFLFYYEYGKSLNIDVISNNKRFL